MSDKGLSNFDSLWDYDRPAESETRFRALLPAADGQPAQRAELLTQIARAQGLQRRFAAAHATLDELEGGLALLPNRPRVRYWLERGRVFNSAGDRERARPCFERALALAESDPDTQAYAVDAAHMLAIVAPPDEALAWNRRALAFADASADERARRWRGSLLNNIGWAYHAAGDLPAALDYLERALAFRREQGQAEPIRVARWCVARVRRDLGQVDEALAEQRALLGEYEALGERSGYVLEELGECLLLMGDGADARPYFAAAYRELAADPWLVANEPARLERLRRLGENQT
jgi:tetratricopeptide (TPR) repeat protein